MLRTRTSQTVLRRPSEPVAPNIRRRLSEGDHIFFISGKVRGVDQFVMGGFEVDDKIDAVEAYERFPEYRLRKRSDGQLMGNIIVDAFGNQHELDDHSGFCSRIQNYVLGKNPITVASPPEIALCRAQTLEALREILKREGDSPITLVGRSGAKLTELQILALRDWLERLKRDTN